MWRIRWFFAEYSANPTLGGVQICGSLDGTAILSEIFRNYVGVEQELRKQYALKTDKGQKFLKLMGKAYEKILV